MPDDRKVVRVNERKVRGAVFAVLHDELERVEGEQDGRPAFGSDFCPDGFEDLPGDFGVAGSEVAKPGESSATLDGEREIVWEGHLEGVEDVFVGFGDLAEPGCSVCVLAVLGWGCVGDWSVFRGGIYDILCYSSLASHAFK